MSEENEVGELRELSREFGEHTVRLIDTVDGKPVYRELREVVTGTSCDGLARVALKYVEERMNKQLRAIARKTVNESEVFPEEPKMKMEVTEEKLKDWEWRLTGAAIIPSKGYLGITDGDEITEDQFIDLTRKVIPALIAKVRQLKKDVFDTQANYLIPAVNERDRANTKLDRIREVAEPIVQLLARVDNNRKSHIKVDGAPPQHIQTIFPGAKIDGADPFLIDDSVYPKIEAKRILGGIVCDEDDIRNLISLIKEPK